MDLILTYKTVIDLRYYYVVAFIMLICVTSNKMAKRETRADWIFAFTAVAICIVLLWVHKEDSANS